MERGMRMNMFRIGVLRVLTTNEEKELELHGRLLEKYFPFFKTESRCIPGQYDGIYNEETLTRAVPKIIELSKDWSGHLDGLIVSCAGDPAIKELKEVLTIPVTGAGMATASYSLNLGCKIGIIGIEDSPPANYIEILGDKIVEYIKPDGVRTSNDLQTSRGKESILAAGERIKKMGADAIALACTGLSTAGAASLLRNSLGMPVADPVLAEGLAMYGLCVSGSFIGEV